MSDIKNSIQKISITKQRDKQVVAAEIAGILDSYHYEIIESNVDKPWGAYFRVKGNQADRFIHDFFPGLSYADACLGIENAELSPKILLVSPGQRLSWQYHNRRAERWNFLTDGSYNKSATDDEGQVVNAQIGESVQFANGERHRLIGFAGEYTIVAEIWQHADTGNLSNEDDIVRVADDYNRG